MGQVQGVFQRPVDGLDQVVLHLLGDGVVAICIGSGNQLNVTAPFIGMTKAQVVAQGLKLGVPYEMTWSCYEGKEKPCGVCGTCRDRIAAFRANGIEDII